MAAFKISLIYSKLQGRLQPSVLPAKRTNSRVSHRNYHKEFWAKHPKFICHPGKQKHGQGPGAGTTNPREGLILQSLVVLAVLLASLEGALRQSELCTSLMGTPCYETTCFAFLLLQSNAGNHVTVILVRIDQNVMISQLLR